MSSRKVVIILALLALCCNPSYGVYPGEKTGINAKPVSQTFGVTHAGLSYAFDSSPSGMKDGAIKTREMGSEVIKLWFTGDAAMAYPIGCDWSQFTVNNCVDLSKTDYYQEVFDMDFKTFVLEAHTFNKTFTDVYARWDDGLNKQEWDRTEQEMYELTKHLMMTYNGSSKEFVLQNWEGDNMLAGRFYRQDPKTNFYYLVDDGIESANAATDSLVRLRITGIRDWFNARQRGVDRAREELTGKSDVLVRHAVEANFVYFPQDEGWPYSDSPMLLEDVIPETNCDLYSFSCWGTLTIEKAHMLRDRLVCYEQKLGNTFLNPYNSMREEPRRTNTRKGQRSKLMLGEYGAIERFQQTEKGSWGPELNYTTDRRHREVLQIQTDMALALGLEFVIYWELYCNVPRTDTVTPVKINTAQGEIATSNDQMQGNWLIRVDGSCTEGYKYVRGLLDPKRALYIDRPCRLGKTYRIGDEAAGFEISGWLSTDHTPSNLTEEKGFGQEFQVFGSPDGKRYEKIPVEGFFTKYKSLNGIHLLQVCYINRDEAVKTYRYFKVRGEKSDSLLLNRIKLYKPNPHIVKR